MTPRHRRQLIWMAAIVLAVAGVVAWVSRPVEAGDREAIPDSARNRSVAILDQEEWTQYRLPSGARRIRLLSRAFFDAEPDVLMGKEFPYVIEYQLESLKEGEIIMGGAFNLRAKIKSMVDGAGNPARSAFFRDGDEEIAAAKISTIDLVPGDVLTLKLRVRSFYAPISGISVRTSYRQKISGRRLAYMWDRLSIRTLEQIAEHRVHGLVDLTAHEKQAILENRWTPLGPQGVAGRDYQGRLLYTRDDLHKADAGLANSAHEGEIQAGPQRKALVNLPEGGGQIRLLFRSLEEAKDNDSTVNIRYFGKGLTNRDSHSHNHGGSASEFVTKVDEGGLLEITSPVEVAIRSLWMGKDSDEERALTAGSKTARAWLLKEDEEPLVFDLSSGEENQDGGFFRAKLRPVGNEGASMNYRVLSSAGSILAEGTRSVEARTSFYDVQVTRDGEVPANEPVELIWALPGGARSVEITSEGELLLDGFTRPSDLPHQTNVPGDYASAQSGLGSLPVWFGLRPVDAEERIRSHRTAVLRVQRRSPQDNADILAGRYQWEDLRPLEGARGQYVLCSRNPAVKSRIESLPSLFAPLECDADLDLEFVSPGGLTPPTRRLAYFRESAEPAMLKVIVDGKPVFERKLVNARGEVPIPPIKAGSHKIRIECEDSDLQGFINFVAPDRASMLKRYILRLQPEDELVFTVEKKTSEDELLSGVFYTSQPSEMPAEIRVSVSEGESGRFLSASGSFTVRDRNFFLESNPEESTLMLDGAGIELDGGQRFFIPLGQDMAPGSYTIKIKGGAATDGFLTLYRIVGGAYSDARFYKEVAR